MIELQCSRCDSRHEIDSSRARARVEQILASEGWSGLPKLPLARADFFAPGGGKMLGCALARDDRGGSHTLFAFSGMLAGRWCWSGWVEPVFDVRRWRALEAEFDPQIAALTAAIEGADEDPSELRSERAHQSRALMRRYHELYELIGASGQTRSLAQIVGSERMKSGMGDCCAPKLLVAARREGLEVESLVEFFVGVSRRPGRRTHGTVYAPCEEKCGPLLDFLLCPRA